MKLASTLNLQMQRKTENIKRDRGSEMQRDTQSNVKTKRQVDFTKR